jgi:p-cumate 2,3-dioxygenase subunit beta
VTDTLERSALKDAVEEFLYEEASILDGWRLDDWEALFTEDARYFLPSTDVPDSEPGDALALIDDDIVEIRGRVTRLKSRHAHREFPWSRTRRLITNVRIAAVRGDEIDVTANFLIMRVRNLHIAQFTGRYAYTLVRPAGGGEHPFKIRSRRAELDLEVLGADGGVSIIV